MDNSQTAAHKRIPALRLAVWIASAVMFAVMLTLTIYRVATDTTHGRIAVLISNTLLWLIPFAFRPIFKDGIGDVVYAVFVIFTFLASFLGSVLEFYGSVWWYDLAMHFTFGYLGSIIGLFFICKLEKIENLRPVFVIFVCFAVSIMFAGLWEVFEFTTDVLLDGTAQGFPVELADGTYATLVNDTMEDIICNLCGAVLFAIHYTAHVFSGKSLLLDTMKRDFSKKRAKKTQAEKEA